MVVGLKKSLIVMQKKAVHLVRPKHSVFGQIVEGESVLEEIANVKVGANDKPVEDVVIETIEIIK